MKILVFAPNWLGDAVMAVPAVLALRRQDPSAALAVAARPHLAPLYDMVGGVDDVVCLSPAGRLGGWLSAMRDARRLRAASFDLAVLLPNSFRAAWIAARARIPERWGYAADGRSMLLTRAQPMVRGVHQVEYYERLIQTGPASGVRSPESGLRTPDFGRREPSDDAGHRTPDAGRKVRTVLLDVPPDARDWARRTLGEHGWKPGGALVGMAPGAAYGGAKQWPPDRFAGVAAALEADLVRTVLVGSAGDRRTCDAVAQHSGAHVINLAGLTDLRQLAAVMAECRTFVSNDSGAMHLAAAVGLPVVAIFGSTREWETAPMVVGAGRSAHAIVTADVPCRPCMLRECPIEGHPCMTGIDAARVVAEVRQRLDW